jgi:hypothetical protein
MLNCIYSSIGCPDDLVQNGECGLQGGKFDEGFNSFGICLLRTKNLLTTTAKTSQIEVCALQCD